MTSASTSEAERDPVAQVRAFNRLVTERIGALQDEYLDRGRPLGASRLLWEIGDGEDVRTLRGRLGLDSGYLSRLLRALEAEGLVSVGPRPGDRRVRFVSLTERGRAERALLDRRSDELAASLLAPLSEGRRARLVGAMAEVERLLTATLVDLREVDPGAPEVAYCLRSYFTELSERAATGLDLSGGIPDAEEMRAPRGAVVVAYLRSEPVGCCGLKLHQDLLDGRAWAEVKRMWVAPSARGLGLGRRLLEHVEALAREHGVETLRLDTNQHLVEAIAMYRSAGYLDIARYTEEPFATHWFEKHLDGGRG